MYEEPTRSRYEIIMLEDPLQDDFPDPNAPRLFCRPCAADHHAYWDEMWKMYYGGWF